MTNEASPSASKAFEAGPGKFPGWLRIALIGRRPRFTMVRIVLIAAVAFVLFGFILLPVRIDGPSMLPAYREGRFNLVNRLAYFRHEPRRGDVVTIRISGREYSSHELLHDLRYARLQFRRLFRPRIMYMKRIVGLPGETVEFSGGRLLVDGKPLDEPYCVFPCDWERPPQKLGSDQYFLVGDNRAMPMEYHEFGVPERARIVGKVIL
jgi:signal peptidase I